MTRENESQSERVLEYVFTRLHIRRARKHLLKSVCIFLSSSASLLAVVAIRLRNAPVQSHTSLCVQPSTDTPPGETHGESGRKGRRHGRTNNYVLGGEHTHFLDRAPPTEELPTHTTGIVVYIHVVMEPTGDKIRR